MSTTSEVIIPENEPDIIIEDIASSPDAMLSDSPEDGVEDLRRQLAESRQREKDAREEAERAKTVANEEARRRADADRMARENYNAANTSSQEARELEYQNIVNAHSAMSATVNALSEQLVKANTDGDFAAAAKLQVELGKASAKLERLEDGKAQIEEQRRTAPAKPATVDTRESSEEFGRRAWSTQEYENVLRGYTATTAAWLRANPRFATDPQFRQQVTSAHSLLVAKNVKPDTDEYFRGVEELIGTRNAEPGMEQPRDAANAVNVNKENAVSSANKPTQARTSPSAAAPPSRTAPAGDSAPNNSNRVQLTAEQRRMAQLMFPKSSPNDPDPEVVYAKHWRELKKEGRLIQGGVII